MIYPVAVLGIAAGVIMLLLWKVVPIFTTLFNGLDVDLPLPTRIVIGSEQLRRQHLRIGASWCFSSRRRRCHEVLVRHAAGPHGARPRFC